MSILEQITNGIRLGKEKANEELQRIGCFDTCEQRNDDFRSELTLAENTLYMKGLLEAGYRGRFQLIYIDPPFFTKSKFNASVNLRTCDGQTHRIHHLAFDDRFERNLECYIANMAERLALMKELLSDEGLIWVHLDWHSSHYVKIILDEIMGERNFVNEIIWCYKSGGSGKKHFSRKHDSILVYSKTKNYYMDIPEEKSYNRGFKPYNFKGVKEYCDEQGWYTLVNMKDVWNVDMVGRTSAERTGYATQKPLELMKRIIQAGSREGDLVADFFCGSGSLLEAAELLGRKWVGCDSEKLAFSMARKRLRNVGADFLPKYLDDDTRQSTTYERGLRLLESSGGADASNLVISVSERLPLADGRMMLRCSVRKFIPDIDIGYIMLNDRKHIEASLAVDSMQFIDYIMVDDSLTGGFENPRIIDSGFDDILLKIDREASGVSKLTGAGESENIGKIHLAVVDIFGNEYLTEISLTDVGHDA